MIASICALWLLFYDPIIIIIIILHYYIRFMYVEMSEIQWTYYSRLARARQWKNINSFVCPLDFSPCLQQYYGRRAIQCRFGRIASGAVHRNGIFLREFLQLVDLFENRRLSLNFFRAIWREKEKFHSSGVVLNLHSNKNLICVSKKFHKNSLFLWKKNCWNISID